MTYAATADLGRVADDQRSPMRCRTMVASAIGNSSSCSNSRSLAISPLRVPGHAAFAAEFVMLPAGTGVYGDRVGRPAASAREWGTGLGVDNPQGTVRLRASKRGTRNNRLAFASE